MCVGAAVGMAVVGAKVGGYEGTPVVVLVFFRLSVGLLL